MAKIMYNKTDGKSRGYGFVSVLDPKDCARAIREMNQSWLGSRPIQVKRSEWKDREWKEVQKRKRKDGRGKKHFEWGKPPTLVWESRSVKLLTSTIQSNHNMQQRKAFLKVAVTKQLEAVRSLSVSPDDDVRREVTTTRQLSICNIPERKKHT
eukprot:scaffold13607_cov117-Skeletonema_dohrnii-CCMP3373.AAC.5